MSNFCTIFSSEYKHEFTERKLSPVEKYIPLDCVAGPVEDWQIDPTLASAITEIDENAMKLVQKRILENLKTIYQVTYKNPKEKYESVEERDVTSPDEEKDFGRELLAYVKRLYYDPHTEKVLAPPGTAKRVFGYLSPKMLHGNLSMYQATFGRTGGIVMLENIHLEKSDQEQHRDANIKRDDPCED